MRVVFPASGWEIIAKVRRREISRITEGTKLVVAEVVTGKRALSGSVLFGNLEVSLGQDSKPVPGRGATAASPYTTTITCLGKRPWQEFRNNLSRIHSYGPC